MKYSAYMNNRGNVYYIKTVKDKDEFLKGYTNIGALTFLREISMRSGSLYRMAQGVYIRKDS